MMSTAVCSLTGIHCISCIRQLELTKSLGGCPQKDAVLYKIKFSERHSRGLCLLFEKKGIVISKDNLISHIWFDSIVGFSSLSVLIYELRELLKYLDVSIITVRGKGYVLVDDEHILKPPVLLPKSATPGQGEGL